MAKEKIKIQGLARISGWIFNCWGASVAVLGFYHAFLGEPEANLYSPVPWQFVTKEQWLRWSGFEIAYGLAACALGIACFEFAKRLPEWVEREKVSADKIFQ